MNLKYITILRRYTWLEDDYKWTNVHYQPGYKVSNSMYIITYTLSFVSTFNKYYKSFIK